MRLSDLESFVLAVEEGSLSAAARRLFVSQPAVSARLRRLEREMGERLLVRSGRGVHPTAGGSRLYARCRPLLEELRRLELEFRAEETLRGRLAIGATDLVAIYHLPAVLVELRRRFPALEVSVQVEGTAVLLRALDAGTVELAIVTLPVSGARVDVSPLFRDPLVVVAAPGHPLATRRRVTARAISGEAWLSHKRDSITRLSVEAFFAAHGVALRTEMEISSPEAIKALVKARLGVAALPARAVRRELQEKELTAIPVQGFNVERGSGLATRKGAPLSRAARALVGLLREERTAVRPSRGDSRRAKASTVAAEGPVARAARRGRGRPPTPRPEPESRDGAAPPRTRRRS